MNYNSTQNNNVPPNPNSEPFNPMMGMNQNPGNLNTSIPEKPPRKNLLPLIIVIIVLILGIGGFITYKSILSSPKRIFETTIKNVYKGISNSLDTVEHFNETFDVENKALTFDADLKIDTNLDESGELLGFDINELELGAGIGIDANKQEATTNAFIKGEKEKITVNGYYTDKKVYLETNLLDKLIYVEGKDLNIDFDQVNEVIKDIKNNLPSTSDVDYLVKAITEALADSLDESSMSKNEEKVTINDDDKTLTKYSYKLTDKAIRSLLEGTIDKLSKDSKVIEILTKISYLSEDEVKDYLADLKDSIEELEFEDKLVLNVYTQGFFNKFAGLSIELENEEIIKYFDDGQAFTITIVDGSEKIYIKGNREDDATKIKIEYSNDLVLNLTVQEFSREKIDLSFKLENGTNSIDGTIYLTSKENKNKVDGEYKIKVEFQKMYVTLSGNYKFTSSDSLEIPSTKNAENINKVDKDEVINNLKEKTENDEILSSLFGSYIEEYETPPMNLDFNSMLIVSSVKDLQKIINKKGSSVIYIGESVYTADDIEKNQLLTDLKELQNNLNFHSYRLSSIFYDEAKSLFDDTTPSCSGETCLELPVVYFVKDGRVISALSAPTTKENITLALQSIGIE